MAQRGCACRKAPPAAFRGEGAGGRDQAARQKRGVDFSVRVTFIDSSGVARTIEATAGMSVMEAALAHHIPEVESDCGGSCTCAMCHVIVDEAWFGKFATASKNEASLLSLLEVLKPNSRLSCQLKLSAQMDGLIVHTLDPNAGA